MVWNRELLSDAARIDSSFIDLPDTSFAHTVKHDDSDSLGIKAGMTFDNGSRMHFSLQWGTEFYRGGDRTVYGKGAWIWHF